MADKPCLYE